LFVCFVCLFVCSFGKCSCRTSCGFLSSHCGHSHVGVFNVDGRLAHGELEDIWPWPIRSTSRLTQARKPLVSRCSDRDSNPAQPESGGLGRSNIARALSSGPHVAVKADLVLYINLTWAFCCPICGRQQDFYTAHWFGGRGREILPPNLPKYYFVVCVIR
jgi:hypothetical protein